MSTLHLVSLTALNRNTAVLRQAVTDQRLVLLTQHGRVALAVVNVELFEQLLTIAEQAAALLGQPDLRQLGHALAHFEDAPLLADRAALAGQRAELARAIAGEQTP